MVDDQAPFRTVARTLVGLISGWRVVGEAASGEEGVELALRERPDLVLMDVHLPGINGIEAARRITARDEAAVVVLVSTYADEDLPSGASSCGAAGYVRKDRLSPQVLREFAG
ncbi:response regulator [Streptomyces fractus]|uniref:response regulator n=1 Tax=Streptomyces fractus TaxID=641806 RepID=UPI003CECA3A7